jgi:transcription repressor NrdR-like protein
VARGVIANFGGELVFPCAVSPRTCPECGSHAQVVDVRDVGSGKGEHVRRCRECLKCGLRYTTREIASVGIRREAPPIE